MTVILSPQEESRLRETVYTALREGKNDIVWQARMYRIEASFVPHSLNDFTIFVIEEEGRILVRERLQFGEHGEWGRAQEKMYTASDEELLITVQPRSGTVKPHPVLGEGYPAVRVEWELPPPMTRPQDVRAAALFHLLLRHKGEIGPDAHPYVLAAMASAPDVVLHMYRTIPEQLLVRVNGSPVQGDAAAVALLGPYRHLDFIEQLGITVSFGKKKIYSIPKTATRVWQILVQKPFCDIANTLLMEREKIGEEDLSEEELMKLGDRVFHRLLKTQSGYSRAQTQNLPPPSDEEILEAVRDALHYLLSVRASLPRAQILSPRIISGSAPPRSLQHMAKLMADLFSSAGRVSSRNYFLHRGVILPPEQLGQRATFTESVQWFQTGGIDIDSLLSRVYRGLIGKVTWVLDVSGSMEHTFMLTQQLIKDLRSWIVNSRQATRVGQGAKLEEWEIVALTGGRLFVFSPDQDASFHMGDDTPLYPALEYAKSRNPDIMIVFTDWEHNTNDAQILLYQQGQWVKGTTIHAPGLPLFPWAKNVLCISNTDRAYPPQLDSREEVYNVVTRLFRDSYWEFLSIVAEFASSLLAYKGEVVVSRSENMLTLTIREREW